MMYKELEKICSMYSEEKLYRMEKKLFEGVNHNLSYERVKFEMELFERELENNLSLYIEYYPEIYILKKKMQDRSYCVSQEDVATLLLFKLKFGFKCYLYGSYHCAKRMLEERKEILKKVNVYLDHFSASDLTNFEDIIFDKYDKYYRAALEIQRLKRMFKGEYAAWYKICDIERMLKDAYFDKDVLDDIYKSILKFQLQNGVSIYLYSGLPMLKNHLEMFS